MTTNTATQPHLHMPADDGTCLTCGKPLIYNQNSTWYDPAPEAAADLTTERTEIARNIKP